MYYIICPKCNKDVAGKIIKQKSIDKPKPKLIVSITSRKHKNLLKEQCDGAGILVPWSMVENRF